ncbi:MAG TPA: hypothetical protein VFW71_10125 [Actinomycetota bacterium]|nr:hypothetical protein [Actinomycetota bacterium]
MAYPVGVGVREFSQRGVGAVPEALNGWAHESRWCLPGGGRDLQEPPCFFRSVIVLRAGETIDRSELAACISREAEVIVLSVGFPQTDVQIGEVEAALTLAIERLSPLEALLVGTVDEALDLLLPGDYVVAARAPRALVPERLRADTVGPQFAGDGKPEDRQRHAASTSEEKGCLLSTAPAR